MKSLKNKILKITSGLLFILVSISVSAQTNRVPFSSYQYSYIQYDSCFLEHYGKNEKPNKFYNKLEKLVFTGEGNISIVHLGGSHIQAGIWSWEMRKNFESMMPGMEGAPGMVFPFSIANTNHPFFYRSKTEGKWEFAKITDKEPITTLGLAGMTAFTTDSIAKIDVYFNQVAKIEKHKFNKLSIFHNTEDTSWLITVAHSELLDTSFINENTGATEFYFSKKLDTLSFTVSKKDSCSTAFHFYGAYLENNEPGIIYTGIGINGAATHSYLKEQLFEKHLLTVNPDLVILSIGVNDASGPGFNEDVYVFNYKKIIDKIMSVNPDCEILLTTNNDFYYYRGGVNPHAPAIYSGMKRVADFYGGSVWNMYRVMGGYKSINLWKSDNLANKDRIHFTRDGYTIIADLLFDAILKDFTNYLQTLPEDRIKIE